MRPTKEAQDQYFRENSLDPWGYGSPLVQARLDESIRFIRRFLPQEFEGTFVEIGAFNGDFTRRLAATFPRATVLASDIVKAPWESATVKASFPPTVTFHWCDMMDFQMPQRPVPKPSVLLLMECLYYLPSDLQPKAVERLAGITAAKFVFVSAPLDSGAQYLSERSISAMFQRFWPRKLGFRTVMPIGAVERLHQYWFRRLMHKPGIPRQVIFGFKKIFLFMVGFDSGYDAWELTQVVGSTFAALT